MPQYQALKERAPEVLAVLEERVAQRRDSAPLLLLHWEEWESGLG